MTGTLTTLFIGRNHIKRETVDSTNSHLAKLCSKTSLPEGTLVTTDFQTSGRGQTDKGWASETGKNLLLSVLLKPDFLPVKKIFLLSKAVSLAIKDVLVEFDITARIKWPNDIYVKQKKICGVLIENTMRGTQVQHSIVGIGLNINQELFPSDIPNPTSMKLVTGKNHLLDDCLNSLYNHLEKRYLQLKSGHFYELSQEYLDSLYGFREKHFYKILNNASQGKFQATIDEVNDDGVISLRKEDGSVNRFAFKEVQLLN